MSSTLVVLGSFLALTAISGCAAASVEPATTLVDRIEVRNIGTARPKPILPSSSALRLREVKWIVITPENAEQRISEIHESGASLFAVTAEGYQAIILNLNDVRSAMEEYQEIIAVYETSYEN